MSKKQSTHSKVTVSSIKKLVLENKISLEQLNSLVLESLEKPNKIEAIKNGSEIIETAEEDFKFSFESMLTFIGGGLLLIGLYVLISANWQNFGDSGKIMVTLGVGVFIALSSIFTQPIFKKTYFLNTTQILAGILISSGVFVAISLSEPNINERIVYGMIFGFLSLVYLILNRNFKKGVLTFGSLGFATFSYIYLVDYLLNFKLAYLNTYRFAYLAAVLIGIIYLIVSKLIWKTKSNFFKALILNIGAIIVLYSTFGLVQSTSGQIYMPNDSTKEIWMGSKILEHMYIFVPISFYYLAQKIKSKVLLLSTSIGLFSWVMYMIYVRYELSSNIGIGLMIGGSVFIVIAYIYYRMSKKINENA